MRLTSFTVLCFRVWAPAASPFFLLLYRLACLTSPWALSPSWQCRLQSPFCLFHFNYSNRRPHSTAHFQVSLERRTSLPGKSIYVHLTEWSNSPTHPLLPVGVLPNLPGQAVSNESGVWAKLFGCVISFIMPFIGGPGVINKQQSELRCGIADGWEAASKASRL